MHYYTMENKELELELVCLLNKSVIEDSSVNLCSFPPTVTHMFIVSPGK